VSKLTQRCRGSKPMVLIQLVTTVKVTIFAPILRHLGNSYGTPTVKLTAKTSQKLRFSSIKRNYRNFPVSNFGLFSRVFTGSVFGKISFSLKQTHAPCFTNMLTINNSGWFGGLVGSACFCKYKSFQNKFLVNHHHQHIRTSKILVTFHQVGFQEPLYIYI